MSGAPTADGMTFVDETERAEWTGTQIHATLRDVVRDAREHAATLGWTFFVTSVLRTQAEDEALGGSGVHVYGRALDVRTQGIDSSKVASVVAHLNGRWAYDPARPTMPVAFADPHGTGPHLHIQVHDATRRR